MHNSFQLSNASSVLFNFLPFFTRQIIAVHVYAQLSSTSFVQTNSWEALNILTCHVNAGSYHILKTQQIPSWVNTKSFFIAINIAAVIKDCNKKLPKPLPVTLAEIAISWYFTHLTYISLQQFSWRMIFCKCLFFMWEYNTVKETFKWHCFPFSLSTPRPPMQWQYENILYEFKCAANKNEKILLLSVRGITCDDLL